MAQQRYDRLAKRLDRIERCSSKQGPIIIVHNLGEDPSLRAAAINESGRRWPLVIDTGVYRSDPDPQYCSRESVAAALPQAKALIAVRARQNDNGHAQKTEKHWLRLCERFDLDFEMYRRALRPNRENADEVRRPPE